MSRAKMESMGVDCAVYFHHVRTEIIENVPIGSNVVLDVGCASGDLGQHLKLCKRARSIVGIEIDPDAAREASTKIDQVMMADLNQSGVDDVLIDYAENVFDCIICGDVLEHLINPWETLKCLMKYVRPGGRIVVSIPNVRHWSVWVPLIGSGNWDYQPSGILDRTHLRFFTKKTGLAMCEAANLSVIRQLPLLGGKSLTLDRLTFGALTDFLAVQWVYVCEK